MGQLAGSSCQAQYYSYRYPFSDADCSLQSNGPNYPNRYSAGGVFLNVTGVQGVVVTRLTLTMAVTNTDQFVDLYYRCRPASYTPTASISAATWTLSGTPDPTTDDTVLPGCSFRGSPVTTVYTSIYGYMSAELIEPYRNVTLTPISGSCFLPGGGTYAIQAPGGPVASSTFGTYSCYNNQNIDIKVGWQYSSQPPASIPGVIDYLGTSVTSGAANGQTNLWGQQRSTVHYNFQASSGARPIYTVADASSAPK